MPVTSDVLRDAHSQSAASRAGSVGSPAIRSAPTKLIPNLFALIIGINAYPNLKPLSGAVADADDMKRFLTTDLGVPPDHIISLVDGAATRLAIGGGFDALQNDRRIRKGDPILIFYAGHGGLGPASPEWKAKYGYDDIQVIFPYDYDPNPSEPTKSTNCIPDTTIRGYLNRLAVAKGNNITVILDSCYSASGDRTDDIGGRIARDAEVEVDVPCDIDADIALPNLRTGPLSDRNLNEPRCPELPLFTDQGSHVLFSACGSNQKAWEGKGRGDFTKVLLTGIRANGVHNITYENLITSLERLPGDQTPHCYGLHKSRILFDSQNPSRKAPFIPVDLTSDTWILQAGLASGVTTGSVWALHDTAVEDSQPVGYLQALKPDVSATALAEPQAGSLGPSIPPLPGRIGIDRMYARQFRPGVGQELCVYFSPEARNLIFGPGLNKHPQDLVRATQDDACYTEHKTRDGADLAVDIYPPKTTPKSSKPGAGTEVTFTLLCSRLQAERYGVETLEKRTPASRDEVERVLFSAARWHWHLKRVNPSAGSGPGVSLELMKLGIKYGDCVRTLEGQENLIKQGVVDLKVRKEDQYGIKVSNQSYDELYIRILYFAANDFSIVDMFGHSRANGRQDPDIPKRGMRVIGDQADGGDLLSFGLAQGDNFELGFVKVFWSTDPLELDDVSQESPFESDEYREPRGPIMTRSKRWGAELITLVQRA